jgi:hypothetical protein
MNPIDYGASSAAVTYAIWICRCAGFRLLERVVTGMQIAAEK